MTTSTGLGIWASRAVCTLILMAGIQSAFAGQVYVTGWTTSNDIYTNLNQQFPNTGPGTPGSGVGTANATYFYDPATYTSTNFVAGSDNATNGIDFTLASDGAGQDFEELGNGGNLLASTSVANATGVYLLTAAYYGVSYDVTFTGTGGATETFSGVSAPNFCAGGALNTTSGGALDQSVLEVDDVGACGTGNSSTGPDTQYFLYEQSFTLNPSFNGQSLTGISITSEGNTLLVLGITAANSTPSATPEPSTLALLGVALTGLGLLRRYRRSPPPENQH